MKEIKIEIPNGKEARWVNNVLTLVDKQRDAVQLSEGDTAILLADTVFSGHVGVQRQITVKSGAVVTVTTPMRGSSEVRYRDDYLAVVSHENLRPCLTEATFKYDVNDEVKFINFGIIKLVVYRRKLVDGVPHYWLQDVNGISYPCYPESDLEPWGSRAVKPQSITDCIKTFEDACEWCEENSRAVLVAQYNIIENQLYTWGKSVNKDIFAYLKLRIITAALNEGWEPTYEDGERYRVTYDLDVKDCLVIKEAKAITCDKNLVLKSRELAEYAAIQFKDIYSSFCWSK